MIKNRLFNSAQFNDGINVITLAFAGSVNFADHKETPQTNHYIISTSQGRL